MDTLAGGAILVDRSGRRFIDEGLGGIAHSNAIARLDDPLAVTAIFDHAIWETTGRAELVPPIHNSSPRAAPDRRSRPRRHCAENRCASAERCTQTIETYNQSRQPPTRGDRLDPPRTSGRMFGGIAQRTASA